MKCYACNYEYYHDTEGGTKIGDEEFRSVHTTAFYKDRESNLGITWLDLVICPKCHTVRTEG
jgi:hypothetical protein